MTVVISTTVLALVSQENPLFLDCGRFVCPLGCAGQEAFGTKRKLALHLALHCFRHFFAFLRHDFFELYKVLGAAYALGVESDALLILRNLAEKGWLMAWTII